VVAEVPFDVFEAAGVEVVDAFGATGEPAADTYRETPFVPVAIGVKVAVFPFEAGFGVATRVGFGGALTATATATVGSATCSRG